MFTPKESVAVEVNEHVTRHLNWLQRAAQEHGYDSITTKSHRTRGKIQSANGILSGWKVRVFVTFDPDEPGVRDFLDSFFESIDDPFPYEERSEHYTHSLRNVPDDHREREYSPVKEIPARYKPATTKPNS